MLFCTIVGRPGILSRLIRSGNNSVFVDNDVVVLVTVLDVIGADGSAATVAAAIVVWLLDRRDEVLSGDRLGDNSDDIPTVFPISSVTLYDDDDDVVVVVVVALAVVPAGTTCFDDSFCCCWGE